MTRFHVLALLCLLGLLAACSSDGGADPNALDSTSSSDTGAVSLDAGVHEDGTIGDGGGGCLDPDMGRHDAPDLGMADASLGCLTDDDCAEAFPPAAVPPCMKPVCLEATGQCGLLPTADGDPCDDGDPCTPEDACAAGACVGSGAVDCDDGNPCTNDTCAAGQGCVSANNDHACDDGDPCTVGDACALGVCRPGGETLACDDGDVCTDDVCQPGEGCVSTNNQEPCDDGDACTLGDVCTDGACAPGVDTLTCDDSDVCTDDTCAPTVGCVFTANTAACDDGEPCTEGDTCQDGVCVPGPSICGCEVDDDCADLEDGLACNGTLFCDTTQWPPGCAVRPGSVVECAPGDDPCAPIACAEPAGECLASPLPDGTTCDDGDPCTLGDACQAGVCTAGAETLACDDQNPCTDDVCVPGEGCQRTPNDAACDDGDACTDGDTCVDGACVGGPARDCDDSEPCTDDACVAGSGCVHAPNTASCDDGNPCTVGDTCVEGACIPGADECECTEDADCAPLEDGDVCNGTLVCDTAVSPTRCVVDPTTVIACPAPADPCRAATCDPATGACGDGPAPDGTACDDGDECTGGDRCLGGECVAGTEPLCGPCPPEMAAIGSTHCMDRWEASRPDAASGWSGSDVSRAASQPGVRPWFPVTAEQAMAACEAAGKRLCTLDEWVGSCRGSADTNYVYGDAYDPTVCNSIDTFCNCDDGACADEPVCPYPHCRGTCGASQRPLDTGAMPGCVNEWGVFDINGNVWELVDGGDGNTFYKGGAYNCIDSERLHHCDFVAQNISAKGFRCCRDQVAE